MTDKPVDKAAASPVGVAAAAERLWCWLGHHAPDGTLVWHQGYGFAHCRRCSRPIVRSLLSRWTVPGPGLRIVWDKPANRPAAPADAPQPVAIQAAPPPRDEAPAAVQQEAAVATPAIAQAAPLSSVETTSEEPASPVVPASTGKADTVTAADAPVVTDVESEPERVEPAAEHAAPTGSPGPPPLLSVLEPEPVPFDLLGPNFMGDQGPPPTPRLGLSVFEFDDMAADDDGMNLGVAAGGR